MVKYFYRLKASNTDKIGIRAQKIDGYKITNKWQEFPKKLDVTNLEQYIEEKIEESYPDKLKKADYLEILMNRGFPQSELKDKKVSELKALLELDNEIENDGNN